MNWTLTIPEKYRTMIIGRVNELNGKVVCLYYNCNFDDHESAAEIMDLETRERGSDSGGATVLKEWLEEIRDDPVTTDGLTALFAIEYEGIELTMETLKDIVGRTEDNQKKRHQPQQTYQEWQEKMFPGWTAEQLSYGKIVWEASEKNLGY